MKLHIFGSASGVEPHEGMHHTALAAEAGGQVYWFDAGECCSHTAHLMGVDLLSIRKIFISHTHMDHIGGLGNLLWTIRKLFTRTGRMPDCGFVEVMIPDRRIYDAQLALLAGTEGGFECPFPVRGAEFADGLIFDDGTAAVEAMHNRHLPHNDGDPWRSFSFRVTLREGGQVRRVVYSGDVKSPDELTPWLAEGCDLFLMETGHHDPLKVADLIRAQAFPVGKLVFLHHGRRVLYNRAEIQAALEASCPVPFAIAEDGMTVAL